jgi:tetratricopeptide (TPR) repeat protein
VRKSIFVLLLAFTSVSAQAAGYDDFSQGLAANQRGDAIMAITFFSSAIAASDLSPALLPQAYRNRGLAYLRVGRCALALADLDKALTLKPGDYDTLGTRASAHVCAGDTAAALADFTTMIAQSPNADVYGARGHLRWRTGDFSSAADDFASELNLNRANGYAMLWLEVARIGAGTFDPAVAAKDGSDVSSHAWPGRAVALYGGDATPEEVDSAAQRGDKLPVATQQCEADFFIAEWLLARKDTDGARTRLQQAAARCPRGFPFVRIALERLK